MKPISAPSHSGNEVLDRASALYEALLGRAIDDGARNAIAAQRADETDAGFALAVQLLYSAEFMERLVDRAIEAHLFLIHRARQIMVRRLLPSAGAILDLGGINAPLFRIGYAHSFRRMVIVDLPPDERHLAYRDIRFDAPEGCGEVTIHYGDMTSLGHFADSTFDLVWSGQSIEHVEPQAASRMCSEALRVLRPGGHFCLDTPNRAITTIHTREIGGGFVHPDHKYEYRASELRELLRGFGFEIEMERGICEMPKTVQTGRFHYEDFALGNPIANNAEDGYILFFRCRKPEVVRSQ